MVAEFVNIVPSELTFPFELKKQISSGLRLFNNTDDHVAYKVKTTSPKKYCVRPNTGIIPPKSSADILVIMQAQKEAPADMVCRDKFLVQSVVIPSGSPVNEITQEMFAKEDGKEIQESKLRVVYVPPRPPSPVPESPEEGPQSPAVPHAPASAANASRSHSEVSEGTTDSAAFSSFLNTNDVSELKGKLEQAFRNLASLTEERNGLKRENDKLQQELSKSKAEMSSKISSAVNASREVSDAHKKSQTATVKKSGWSTLMLLLVAILFFVSGYFLAVSNVSKSQV